VKNNSGGRKIASAKHSTQLPRLKRIEGQVRGLQQMIENERDCVELAEPSIAGKLPAAKGRRLANDVGVLMARLG
jgi:hypothetical protein